jgi:alpha-galactosidase
LAGRLDAAPLTVPAVARRPVYSTWYTFTQDLDQTVVADETALAVRLGCGSVFVDDGWQRMAHGRGYAGCGDWVPDTDKFADLARFSATVHDHRAGGDDLMDHDHAAGVDRAVGVVLWIAPLLLGPDAGIYPRLASYAPHRVDQLRCFVLDPRHREVRDHLSATCRRLVVDYDLDGLKIDFLDQAMVYRGTPSAGDVGDVGEAMRMLLAAIRTELAQAGRADCAVEFRQPYVSPAIGAYGQILRASDCPADAVVNRRSTIDARVLSVGQVVHGDMVMWGPTGGPEAVAQQLYGCWFAVPQISMRLADLPSDQSEALAGLLSLWQRQAPAVLEGSLSVQGSERNYDLVRAHHPELGQTVIGRYAPIVVDVDTTGEVTILNATAEDSVIVRLATGHTVRRGLVRGASTTIAGEHGPLTAGVHEIAVPPFGSLTLVVSTHAAGGAAVSDPVDLLRGARHVVVQDYPSRDIPDALTRAGFLVTIYGGPTEADVVVSERSGDEIVHRRVGRYPEHADLLYTYRPVSELDAILAEADRLGVRTVWRQPALGGEDVDAAEWRGRVEAAGLRYVDYPPIDEAAASVGH